MSTNVIGRGESNGRCWIAIHEKIDNADDKIRKYFFCTRGDVAIPHKDKKPEAVVAIAYYEDAGQTKIVVTKEYRTPIDDFEIGSVAGLIEKKDYAETQSIEEAAKKAAIREFKEETGLDFVPFEVSPYNLYSSAGLTNESVILVVGKAQGVISREFLEKGEDIHTMLLNRDEVIQIIENKKTAFSKHVWPFLWSIKMFGFPSF